VFFGDGRNGPAVISYPMADRGGDVQALIVSDSALSITTFGIWQRGERGPSGTIRWEPLTQPAWATTSCP
jgi:hypothetical protein